MYSFVWVFGCTFYRTITHTCTFSANWLKLIVKKRSIAVRKKPHRYGNSRAIWDHTVLPATRQRWYSRLPFVPKECYLQQIANTSSNSASNSYQHSQCSMFIGPLSIQNTLWALLLKITQHNTHTRLTALFPGLPRWAGTRKVKPIWILLKQETVSGSGISWAICKSAPRIRQITMSAPHHSVFLQAGCPSCRPTNSIKALKAKMHP